MLLLCFKNKCARVLQITIIKNESVFYLTVGEQLEIGKYRDLSSNELDKY